MNYINLKLQKEVLSKYHRKIYIIDQDIFIYDGREFKVKKSLSNLSKYLQKNNKNLIEVFSVDNVCKQCKKETYKFFARNKLTVYDFCSIECQQKYNKENNIQHCPICGKNFLYKEKKKKYYGTCGNENCIHEHKCNRNKNIKNNHWRKRNDSDEIEQRRITTRLMKDKSLNRVYTPWNKGKTNVYSKETIDKIRNATIKQMQEGKIKKTKIEEKIENFLKEQNIDYIYSFILNRRQYDFCIKNYNILIEADGDYWHGNPKIYDVLSERQHLKQLDDKIKDRIAKENGYTILRFWEKDINLNFEDVKTKINNEIHEKKLL